MEKMNWFAIWCEDYDSLINTAVRNLYSDLEAGYNPNGESVRRSREVIAEFKKRYADGLEAMKEMDEKKADRWCYLDLKKRGAVS